MFRRGYTPTEEHKQKLRENHKGMLGKRHSQKTIEKMSITKLGKKMPWVVGENNVNWKNGVSKNIKYTSWIKNKRNRLKRTLNNGGSLHTWEDWNLLKIKYNFTCPCCHRSEPEINLTEDHITPISLGGDDSIENIQPLCLSCNVKKHTKVFKY